VPVIASVTCPVCGTFCDDIELIIENNKIIEAKNACAMGAAKFLNYNDHRIKTPLIRKNGELVEVSMDEAIEKAAQILVDAQYPLLYGWSNTCCEAQRVGVALAEEVGGVMDNTATVCHGPSIMGVQDAGIPGATLGQLRHRADLIIYWASNPWDAHPRHAERYSMFSEGRFEKSTWTQYLSRLRGDMSKKKIQRASNLVLKNDISFDHSKNKSLGLACTMYQNKRRIIVIDVRRTRTADAADCFIQVEPGKDYELLQALRVLVNDGELDVDEVAGIPKDTLEELADILINCKMGVIFFGLGLTMSKGKHRNIDAAINLTRDLNSRTKFLIMPMRGHYNVTGANIVTTWQTGYPFGVDLSNGYPRYNPGETTANDILRRGEADAMLVIASDPVAHFPKSSSQSIARIPLISIDPEVTPTTMLADVILPPSFAGIESEGTAYRMDHVPLPLKKVVEPPKGFISDQEILRRILKKVRDLKKRKMD
jgi:formylmethanofuran dehydrogenase subunit B